jgi:type II secretory pathway pseudopilin PulG
MNLLEVIKINGADKGVGLIEEAIHAVPEFEKIPSRSIKGINFKTVVRTALPNTTAGFRSINAGVSATASVFENRLFEAFPLEATWFIDALAAASAEDGKEALMQIEANGQMQGQMQALAKQFYYGTGTGGNSAGFPGLLQQYDATNMAVDAGGTTATTGSSAWLVKFGPQDVQWLWGNEGQITVTPTGADLWNKPTRIVDSNDTTKTFAGFQQQLLARVGLAVFSKFSVCRIKKLTADSGKGLTDSLIADAIAKFPSGVRPDAIFVSRRSLTQLQKSRSVTIFSGGGGKATSAMENIAPLPSESGGIAIYPTDAILDTEALTL